LREAQRRSNLPPQGHAIASQQRASQCQAASPVGAEMP
jgi:hypothetical protein